MVKVGSFHREINFLIRPMVMYGNIDLHPSRASSVYHRHTESSVLISRILNASFKGRIELVRALKHESNWLIRGLGQ